jgi:hypothetical protein
LRERFAHGSCGRSKKTGDYIKALGYFRGIRVPSAQSASCFDSAFGKFCNFEVRAASNPQQLCRAFPRRIIGITSVTFLIRHIGRLWNSLLMGSRRIISSIASLALAFLLSGFSHAQISGTQQSAFAGPSAAPEYSIVTLMPRLTPDLALTTYEHGMQHQTTGLGGYTATSLIDAELPDSAQKAEFELKQHYAAPAALEFSPLRWSGDSFVKSNVIVRLLQSEVDHVHRREQSETAINSANYKFSYKGSSLINEVPVYVYEVKPHKKRVGLFKGKIYLDASTGELVRAQGRIVKSPSFFIKKIDFIQDYAHVNGFTLPLHLHSEAQTRIIGKAVIDITNRDYQTESLPTHSVVEASAAGAPSTDPGAHQ